MPLSTTTSNLSWKRASKPVGSHGEPRLVRKIAQLLECFPSLGQEEQDHTRKLECGQVATIGNTVHPDHRHHREGGKVTESGVVLCSRPIPFRLVKEVWIFLPSSERGQPFEQV